MRVPRILVFQHMDAGHPGIFRELLQQDDAATHTVRLDLGERIPDLGAFDALWVMGGPQDVWEEAEHPWLADEKAAIREAVLARAMPFLGICLGHQLLADALGGEVGPAAAPEIGVFEVELCDGAARHPLFAGLPERSRFLQWHRAEVRRPPDGAQVLATLAPLRGPGDRRRATRLRPAMPCRGRRRHARRVARATGGGRGSGAGARAGRSGPFRRRGARPHGGVQSRGAPALPELHDAVAGRAAGAGLDPRQQQSSGRTRPRSAIIEQRLEPPVSWKYATSGVTADPKQEHQPIGCVCANSKYRARAR